MTAYSFRKHVQRSMADALLNLPMKNSMEGVSVNIRYDRQEMMSLFRAVEIEFTPLEWLWRVGEGGKISQQAMAPLDIDHEVKSVMKMKGGRIEALKRMEIFLEMNLNRYSTDRNNTENPAVSTLSPWFHFGHISTIEVVVELFKRSNWTYDMTCFEDMGKGTRSGWWGLSESEESFLDQIITWRELGFNFAHYRRDHKSIDSIPNWAKKSLQEHSKDERKPYTFDDIENARTDDEVWNAAQRELLRTGLIHNYMRMVWGKKILEWAPDPNTAADWMIQINDRWALDGRDPNSYTGIFWVLGRHDRAWGPERPVFGKVRYMTTESARRKLKLKNYISRWSENAPLPREIQRL
jgi:deoxyribodipyrimidine photo-lyase